MSYQDRGMKKWGGFLLSEHTEAMQNAEPTLVWKEAMTTEFIESVLASAMTHQSMLVIQKKPLGPEASPENDIIGRISGVEIIPFILRTLKVLSLFPSLLFVM